MKKILIAPDSFKGSLSSEQVCDIINDGIKAYFPDCETISIPIADGGEGTVDAFIKALGGKKKCVRVTGPCFEKIDSFYGHFGDVAVIEMAAAAGLPITKVKDPSATTTYGVGELIRAAIDDGAKEILLGLGGSSTNDGGTGLAAALGCEFYNKDGNTFVPTGKTLCDIKKIDIKKAQSLLSGITITAMCDVENPMFGKDGAAYIYAPQKGADDDMVKLLDENLHYLYTLIKTDLHKDVNVPGAGAAGALGAGVLAFLGGSLKRGINTVLDMTHFSEKITGCDFVITGEGKIDSQSVNGKVISGICERAKAADVPVLAIVGDIGDDAEAAYELGVCAIFSINRRAIPFEVARTRSYSDMQKTVDNLMRFIKTIKK